jgi:hypothetical protein
VSHNIRVVGFLHKLSIKNLRAGPLSTQQSLDSWYVRALTATLLAQMVQYFKIITIALDSGMQSYKKEY